MTYERLWWCEPCQRLHDTEQECLDHDVRFARLTLAYAVALQAAVRR